MRKTVTITTIDYPAPRHFHLEASKAERFAAKIRALGGTASVGPLAMSDSLCAMLARSGVIFRADRKKQPEITAVFPSECGTDEYDFTCYVHIGQHGSASRGWYNKTRAAKPPEYADLLAELCSIYAPEYKLRVVHRMTRQHAAKRRAQMRGIEKGRAA